MLDLKFFSDQMDFICAMKRWDLSDVAQALMYKQIKDKIDNTNFEKIIQACLEDEFAKPAKILGEVKAMRQHLALAPKDMKLLSAGADPSLRFDRLAAFKLNHDTAASENIKAAVLGAAAAEGFSAEEVQTGVLSDAPEIGTADAGAGIRRLMAEIVGNLETSKKGLTRLAREEEAQLAVDDSAKRTEDSALLRVKVQEYVATHDKPSLRDKSMSALDMIRLIADRSKSKAFHPEVAEAARQWLSENGLGDDVGCGGELDESWIYERIERTTEGVF